MCQKSKVKKFVSGKMLVMKMMPDFAKKKICIESCLDLIFFP
jgi:hypothetical protein